MSSLKINNLSSDMLKYLRMSKLQWCVIILVAIFVSLQALLEGTREVAGGTYTHYNNYLIFKQSFYHLISYQDLYASYPHEHFDLFKYSSTFAALFGFFAVLPDYLGLPLWNLFNLCFFFLALQSVPKLSAKWIGVILCLALLELITTTQNEQSNTFMLGLFLFSFSSLERRKYFWAAFFIFLSIYTKLYGVVAISLFLFYPEKIKALAYLVFWGILLFFLPIVFVDFNQLVSNYSSWFHLLGVEHGQIYGISVMGWLHSWFGLEVHKLVPVFLGVILFCVPLIRYNLYHNYYFRLLGLCSVLIWVVIFNHRAESASYIIAYTGICIWFVIGEKTKWQGLLMFFAFVLVTVSPTDLFPRSWREDYVQMYTLKAVPVIVLWLLIIWKMMSLKTSDEVQSMD